MSAEISLVRHISEFEPAQWNALAGGHPLVSHEFLAALDQQQCAVPETGWAPHYLKLERDGRLVGAMALYLKSHSRGEYVFDHGWARAFAQHGLPYYPKLLAAVPFTPVPGPRLLATSHADRVLLAHQATALAEANELSSVHVLFPSEADRLALQAAGFMFRENVQFHWRNEGYRDMDDFLRRFSQQKRKKIKQDRKRVAGAGVLFKWVEGQDINDDVLSFFYDCYVRTYWEHGNPPYLTKGFFEQLRQTMPDNLVIVLAHQDGAPVAAALNIRHGDTLFGRYWGAQRFISGLHFETCYVQAIEFCIAHGLACFEGGAQGEHKMSRGMLPVKTYSAHWIRDARYAEAIADFLERESMAIDGYMDELQEHSPFKSV